MRFQRLTAGILLLACFTIALGDTDDSAARKVKPPRPYLPFSIGSVRFRDSLEKAIARFGAAVRTGDEGRQSADRRGCGGGYGKGLRQSDHPAEQGALDRKLAEPGRVFLNSFSLSLT